ncbi:ARM repeat-containing protein [Suhomyces tanzawaensis NRRL Y-17324]|uniref:ARM repeat-containing protein n=1 Tax=Suhomyces tanzawaensis NRRL Y-17324 TaxID=984487 RepID=A0A1E4SMM2_9ASCO|nr:ARM repeat-containing protein [Suhomyces tanzawaensis NRRL Y-17324]ODV80632.1 ARM repeat-containing protein [Suhomyces tanzawaensis NRRL Y-17324]
MTSHSNGKRNLVGNYTIPSALADEIRTEHHHDDALSSSQLKQNLTQNEYQQKRHNRVVDLDLNNTKSYKQIMEEREFEREEQRVKQLIERGRQEAEQAQAQEEQVQGQQIQLVARRERKRRWDVTPEEYERNKKSGPERDDNSIVLKLLKLGTKVPIVSGVPLTDEILDKILPPGYIKLDVPSGYEQLEDGKAPDITELPMDRYMPPSADQTKNTLALREQIPTEVPGITGLQSFKQEDMKYFGKLIHLEESSLSGDEKKEVEVMKLLLKVKNGSQVTRKRSLRQLTDSARKFGPKILFNQILPLLLEPSLDDQERHVLVKLTGRLLYHLDDQIRPYTHKVLVVISPMLIDEDFTLRLEAREIISNLTKAAGLANMISSLRPDLDHVDEYVRNITSRVFAIVANTLGLVSFLPFLKAVIKSKKNWMARHTGIKIIQQLCILLGGGNGNSILPYLTQMIEVLTPAITDEVLQVRTITALTLAQLAENVNPYGIESFENVLEPVWVSLRKHRGKGLASFLKCIGAIIPLMCHDPNYEEYANYYSKELVVIITREFSSPDEDTRKTILRILISLPLSRQIINNYESQIMKPFLKSFWNRRTASDSYQLTRLVVDSTVELAKKFDFLEVLESIVIFTKDNNEQLRRMATEAIHKMISPNSDNLIGLDSQLEVKLVDGVLFAFQEQTVQHNIYLQALGTVATALNVRLKPHMDSIISTVLYRLKNKEPEIRQQAAELIALIAPVIKQCSNQEDELLCKLILILYEALGEVFPEVLGSIINALFSCIDTVDKATLYVMSNPSINQILPTLTPILRNRQEKVQEACIKLVGLIAKKNSETINAKEWMRISFELLEMLKSSKKRIRVAANETFGYIAKTIGPQDVIVMLLNNLRVQERQLRVCTAVAIGIVAETCAPFTVLPAIMNEYRIPEKNVQNGVLKALSFLFEYIEGSMAKDYLFAITPLLEDALTDRDQVHRQTAATVIKHIALNCVGLANDSYHEVFVHLLNLLLPNIYETSPHVIIRILESIDALRIVLGVGIFTNYVWAGLFHPARKVRYPYWKMFNSAYAQNSDALVPYYPRIDSFPDDESDNYTIEELDIFI